MPGEKAEEEPSGGLAAMDEVKVAPPPLVTRPAGAARAESAPAMKAPAAGGSSPSTAGSSKRDKENLLEIEPEEGGLEAIISKLKNKP